MKTWDSHMWRELVENLPNYQWVMRGRVMVGQLLADEAQKVELRNLYSSEDTSTEIEVSLFDGDRRFAQQVGSTTTLSALELAIMTTVLLLDKMEKQARADCPAEHTAFQPVGSEICCPECGSRITDGLTLHLTPELDPTTYCDLLHVQDRFECGCGYQAEGTAFTDDLRASA